MKTSDARTIETSRRSSHLNLAGLVLAAVCAAVCLIYGGSYVLTGIGLLAASAALVAGLGLLHAALRGQAAVEARELAAEARGEGAGLFDGDEAAHGKARNLEQFKRYFVPALTLLIAVLEFVFGARLLTLIGARSQELLMAQSLPTAALLAVAGIGLYLFGSYLAGLAFRAGHVTLRALAGEMVGLAGLSAVGAVTALLLRIGLPAYDRLLAYTLAVLLLLRAAEKLLTAVMELYRPRRAGAEERLLYESRVNGLFAQPRGVLGNVTETLNYQFGLRLDEAHLRRVFTVGLPLLLLFELMLLGAFSCLVVVNPGEQALRERWGRPHPAANPLLGPGLHVKLPWPVDRVHRFRVGAVRRLALTQQVPTGDGEAVGEFWTVEPTPTRHLAVSGGAGDDGGGAVNLLAWQGLVDHRIATVSAYLYASAEPEALLASLARREVTRLIATHDFEAVLRMQPEAMRQGLRDRLQAAADARGLGVRVLYFGLNRVQPPAPVAPAFHEVMAARQDRRARIAEAEGKAVVAVADARARAAVNVADAGAEAARRQAEVRARRQNLDDLRQLYGRQPVLFRLRSFLDTFEESAAHTPKTILATDSAGQVLQLDLSRRPSSDLLDMSLPPE